MEHFEGPLNGETLSDVIRRCGHKEGNWCAVVFESVSRMTEFFETLQAALRDEFIFERFTPWGTGVEDDVCLLTNKMSRGILEIMTRGFFEKVIGAQHLKLDYSAILFDTDDTDDLTAPNPALDDFFASLTVVDRR